MTGVNKENKLKGRKNKENKVADWIEKENKLVDLGKDEL